MVREELEDGRKCRGNEGKEMKRDRKAEGSGKPLPSIRGVERSPQLPEPAQENCFGRLEKPLFAYPTFHIPSHIPLSQKLYFWDIPLISRDKANTAQP